MQLRFLVGYFCLIGILSPSTSFSQMVINGYNPNRHDRFVGDRNGVVFVGEGLDLSAVSRSDQTSGRWTTMISPIHFLTSNHAVAMTTVKFHAVDGTQIECTIDPNIGRRIGETDVYLGAIQPDAECDTSRIGYYPIARPDDYVGSTVFAVGRSTRSGSENSTSMRIGRNVLDYVSTGDAFRGSADHAIYVDDSQAGDVFNTPPVQTNKLTEDEFRFANGDSGGPTFLVRADGQMQLFGIHSYLAYDGTSDLDGDGKADDFNGDTFFDFTAFNWASIDTYLPTIRNDILLEISDDLPDFSFQLDANSEPVGPSAREYFVVRSTLDCSLDNEINELDLDCTTWAGSVVRFDQLLEFLELLEGDVDTDGEVGFSDFLVLARNFDQERSYTEGDINRNGIVDFGDYLTLSRNFGQVWMPEEAAAVVAPEPSGRQLVSVVLLMVGAALHRRKSGRQQ